MGEKHFAAIQPEESNCEYCREDGEGYVTPLEKKRSCVCKVWRGWMGTQLKGKRLAWQSACRNRNRMICADSAMKTEIRTGTLKVEGGDAS